MVAATGRAAGAATGQSPLQQFVACFAQPGGDRPMEAAARELTWWSAVHRKLVAGLQHVGLDEGTARRGARHVVRAGLAAVIHGPRTEAAMTAAMERALAEAMGGQLPGGVGTAVGTRRVLVVEDDPELRAVLGEALVHSGFAVATAAAREALAWLARHRPDAALLDLSPPTSPGEVVAAALRTRWGHDVPLVVMSTSDDGEARALALGARAFLRKPFGLAGLLAALGRAGHIPDDGRERAATGCPTRRPG